MQLSALATVLLLPLLAVAQEPTTTTTCTSYLTLTKTITLQRAAEATVASNNTATFTPTRQPTTTSPGAAGPTNAGSVLAPANAALAAVVGLAAAALL